MLLLQTLAVAVTHNLYSADQPRPEVQRLQHQVVVAVDRFVAAAVAAAVVAVVALAVVVVVAVAVLSPALNVARRDTNLLNAKKVVRAVEAAAAAAGEVGATTRATSNPVVVVVAPDRTSRAQMHPPLPTVVVVAVAAPRVAAAGAGAVRVHRRDDSDRDLRTAIPAAPVRAADLRARDRVIANNTHTLAYASNRIESNRTG